MEISKDLLKAIKQAQEGREEGFNKIYSATYNFVYFRSKTIMKTDDEAWDLLQEVYIVAYKSISKLEKPENLYAWLGGIAYNLGMRAYRNKKEVLLDEERAGIFNEIQSVDKDIQPEMVIEDKQTSNIVKELIDLLPPLQKAAVIAYYYDEMSVGDIAEKFECSTGTIKSRLNYARQFLKKAVDEREKKDGIKLHSVTIPTILMALHMLSEESMVSAQTAQTAYNGICSSIGIESTALTTVVNISTVGSGAQAAGTATKATGLIAKFTAASIGTKTVIIGSTVVIGISSAIGGVMINKFKDTKPVESMVTTIEATPTPEILKEKEVMPTVQPELTEPISVPKEDGKEYSTVYDELKKYLMSYDKESDLERYEQYKYSEYFIYDWNNNEPPVLIIRDIYNKVACKYSIQYIDSIDDIKRNEMDEGAIDSVCYIKDNGFVEVVDDYDDSDTLNEYEGHAAYFYKDINGTSIEMEELWFWYKSNDKTYFLNLDEYKKSRAEVESLELIKWYSIDDLSPFK